MQQTTRLLIVSHDVVGSRMAGPGIRYWELARALAAHATVSLVAPQPIDLVAPGVATGSYAWGDAAALDTHLARADAVLANGYVLEAHPELAATGLPLIVDLYDPTLLENLELLRGAAPAERAERTRHDVALLGRQLAAGDLFLCATERQRDLYIGALMGAGRVTPVRADADPLLRGLIDLVPFGLPAEPPVRNGPGLRAALPGVGANDPIVLWSGGLWDWMDPLTLVRAMPALLEQVPSARLVFLAGSHPGAVAKPQAPGQAQAIAAELGLLNTHIFFYSEWVPYAQRADVLLDATVVVSLHRQHLETAYAALRSRFLDHLWAGLPSVLSDGDQAAALAREHDLGLVVPAQDPPAVAAALASLLTDHELRARQAAQVLASAPRFAWPTLVRPIVQFLKTAPTRRPRAVVAPEQSESVMTSSQPAAPPVADVALVERERLLHTTRNSAVQALESSWRLGDLRAPGGGLRGRLRTLLAERVVWPLIQPLIARQQEHNAAVLRASYAAAELSDHQRLTVLQLNQIVARLQLQQDQLQQQLQRHVAELSGQDDHLGLRIDHTQQGMVEVNERAVRERHLVAQQIRDFAEQLAGLEEAEQQLRALLRGEPAPPPTSTKL